MASEYRSLLGYRQGAKKIHVHLTEIADTSRQAGYQHSHAAEEAVYVLEGQAEYTFAGRTHKLGPGELLFFPPGVEHAQVRYLTPSMKYLVIRSVEADDEPCCCGQDKSE